MDIPQILAVLRPHDDWGPCAQSDATYEQFAAGWRLRHAQAIDPDPPTEAEMLATWANLKAANEARDTETKTQAAEVLVDFATYKALTSPTANQRLQFERRVCDVLTAILKRMTHKD